MSNILMQIYPRAKPKQSPGIDLRQDGSSGKPLPNLVSASVVEANAKLNASGERIDQTSLRDCQFLCILDVLHGHCQVPPKSR